VLLLLRPTLCAEDVGYKTVLSAEDWTFIVSERRASFSWRRVWSIAYFSVAS